jgi:hypothetical protein
MPPAQRLLADEETYGSRLPVVAIVRHRVGALEQGATTSSSSERQMPEVASASTGPRVSAATSDPKIEPASHGVPRTRHDRAIPEPCAGSSGAPNPGMRKAPETVVSGAFR